MPRIKLELYKEQKLNSLLLRFLSAGLLKFCETGKPCSKAASDLLG